jgi:hypothetical protein
MEAGDVVVLPVLGGGSVTRVIADATAGAALGRNLVLLRPDLPALDPWFLAGFPRGTANNRQAGGYASTATRSTCAASNCPGSRSTNNVATARASAPSTTSSRALRGAGRLGQRLVRGMRDVRRPDGRDRRARPVINQ